MDFWDHPTATPLSKLSRNQIKHLIKELKELEDSADNIREHCRKQLVKGDTFF